MKMQVTVVMVRQATWVLSMKLEESIVVYLWEKPGSINQIYNNTKDESCCTNFIRQDFSSST